MFKTIFVLLFTSVLCFACDPPMDCRSQASGDFGAKGRVRYEVTPDIGGWMMVTLACERPQLAIYNRCGHCQHLDDCAIARGTDEIRVMLPANTYRIEAHGAGAYNLSVICPNTQSGQPAQPRMKKR